MSFRLRAGTVSTVCFATMALIFLTTSVDAATRTAASCSSSAVLTVINASVTGDTVVVPAGNCTWSTTISLPGSKKLIIQGAGKNATRITRDGVVFNDNGRSGSRITGFEFINGYIEIDGDNWRIDNNRFRNSAFASEGVWVRGDRETVHPSGLIDHNEFIWTRVVVLGWAGLAAHALWAQPSPIGAASAQKVVVEDNVFTATGFNQVIDANYGGRYVFRYNSVTNGYIEFHSLQQGRGGRSWEIYNNTFTATVEQWTPLFIRGGTGVIYNNTLSGPWNANRIILDNVRSISPFDTNLHYGRCGSSSTADGNQQTNGWPCRDQIGRGADSSLARPSSTSGTATGWASQPSEPAYFWNNTGFMAPEIHNGTGAWVQINRDYFNNTQRPGYVAFPYPHPLQTGTTPPPTPSAPTNLHIQQ